MSEVHFPFIPLNITFYFVMLVFAVFAFILAAILYSSQKAGLDFSERRKNMTLTLLVVGGWLMLTQVVALSGWLKDDGFPPRVMWLILPAFLLAVFIGLHKKVFDLLDHLDGFWLVYIQSFRILLEFILVLMYHHQCIPYQMTMEGYNFDVVIGLGALPVAYFCYSRREWPLWVVQVWNVAGLLLLLNVAVISYLSFPGPYRYFAHEPANTLPMRSPFIWLPAFLVPFALMVHLLSMRKVRKAMHMMRRTTSEPGN